MARKVPRIKGAVCKVDIGSSDRVASIVGVCGCCIWPKVLVKGQSTKLFEKFHRNVPLEDTCAIVVRSIEETNLGALLKEPRAIVVPQGRISVQT